jgi:16S rRNA (cytosine1402-N4)-methyltransferase
MGGSRHLSKSQPESDAGEPNAWQKGEVKSIHVPVLFQEVLDGLQVRSGGRYIDATVGGGGHAAGVLDGSSPDGRLLGMDRDPSAIEVAGRVVLVHRSFDQLAQVAQVHQFVPVDGILFDLGFSSLQLSDVNRGFSFMADGPLDMRFDPQTGGPTAADLLNELPVEELAELLYRYGEEKRARRIAQAVVVARPLRTTQDLVAVIEGVMERIGERVGRRERIHPATRTFQALRIAVNDELATVEAALPQAIEILAPGGRLAVISFHSLEDRLVKRFMRRESQDCICPPKVPVCTCHHRATLRLITRKPVRPTAEEVAANPRSRSARLRLAERIA